jgi:hypothetical protein
LINQYRTALDERTIAIFDNGFIPEGSTIQGFVHSRNPSLYPLAEVLSLANLAIKADENNLGLFVSGLSHENEVVRFWSAQGLLLLNKKSRDVESQILAGLADSSDNVRVILAELAVILGYRAQALAVFRELLNSEKPFEIILRALNSLAQLEEHPLELLDDCKKLMAILKSEANNTSGYFNAYSAIRYLIQRIEGTYEPSSHIFDFQLFTQRMQQNNPGLLASMGRDRT